MSELKIRKVVLKILFLLKSSKNKRKINTNKLSKMNLTSLQRRKINQIIKESNSKNKDSTQNMLCFDEILKNGICAIGKNTYSKTIRFFDINYLLSNNEDKVSIFDNYCEFLNYFDDKIKVQLTFFNQEMDTSEFYKHINIKMQNDNFNYLREEYLEMLKNQLEKGNNGIVKSKYITFSVEDEDYKRAKSRLERIELDLLNNFKMMGVLAESLNGYERLEILYNIFYPKEKFVFNYNMIKDTGLTTKDFVAPMSTKIDIKNIQLGSKYCSSFYLQIVVKEMADRILADFLDIENNLLLNIHLKSIEQVEAIKIVQRKKMDVEGQKAESQKKALANGYDMDILPLELQENIDETTSLLEMLKSRHEHLFLATVLVTSFANYKEDLENINMQLKGVAQKHSCNLRCLEYQQEQALNSSLPIGNNLIEIERTLTTTSTAIFVPFTTEELFSSSKESLYYGLNALSNNVIFADRKELKNPNGLILGTPGSGKSFSAKREITNVFLATDDDIMICDPENEFSNLTKAFGGQVINISPNSKDYVNIMDINLNYSDDDNPLTLKSDFLLAFFELVCAGKDGLNAVEKSIIDRCVKLVYQDYLTNPIDENIPILEDLYNLIKKQDEPEAKNLAVSLEIYVTGNFNYFNNKTNVDINNRLVSFNIKDLGNQIKKIGMLVVQDQIWNRISQNRDLKKSTRYYIDEFHLQLKEKQTASYSVEVWKRARKYGGIPTGITQNVKDFLASKEVENIFENSDFVYMLNQGGGDREILARQLNISATQLSYITDSQVGCGLIKYSGIIIPFVDRFPKDTQLYKMMTTKLNEK